MGMKITIVALWVTLMVPFCFKQSLVGGTDSTVVPGASGADVVDATITKIAQVYQCSPSLKPDDRLLLRIAYVETKYGTAPRTYSDPNYHGGIWRVDRDMFDLTQVMYNITEFSDIFEAVSSTLGIVWIQTTWEDCRQPLYSGLAARLFLHNVNPVIPPGWAVQQQATYWRDHYHNPPTGTVNDFVQSMSEMPGCEIKGIDLVFLIDGSGSVGSNDFGTSVNFVSDVVEHFEIGRDRTRVGVIQYSSSVSIEFHLNKYTSKSSLQQAIASITYLSGGTQTTRALEVMVNESFKEENGARGIGIPRVAVVITDGRSQGPDSVRVPADRAREMGINIFAIGVTSNINEAELVAIANEPKDTFVFKVSDFDAIPIIGATLQDTTCYLTFNPRTYNKRDNGSTIAITKENNGVHVCQDKELNNDEPAALSNDVEFNSTIGQNQTQTFEQTITEEGTTFSIKATDGTLDMYGSATVTNPNSALNDFHLTTDEGQGSQSEIFIGTEFFERSRGDGGTRRRRELTTCNQNDSKVKNGSVGIIYVVIEGKKPTNDFILTTTEGDVTKTITEGDGTQPSNGGGAVTTTVPYIALMMWNGLIVARLATTLLTY